jgi:YD repeat-containing protein
LLCLLALAWAAPALAGETATYTYDAQGRVVKVVRSSTTTTQQTQYAYDKAQNRTSKAQTGGGGAWGNFNWGAANWSSQ